MGKRKLRFCIEWRKNWLMHLQLHNVRTIYDTLEIFSFDMFQLKVADERIALRSFFQPHLHVSIKFSPEKGSSCQSLALFENS